MAPNPFAQTLRLNLIHDHKTMRDFYTTYYETLGAYTLGGPDGATWRQWNDYRAVA